MKRIVADESGMTVLEMLVALFIFSLVAGSALMLARQQSFAFSTGASQMNALQNYRFTADLLERNLAATGNNVAPGQPFLVYADSNTLTFNGDYAARDPNDFFAAYIDEEAPAGETGGLPSNRKITIPGSSFRYPQQTYRNGGLTTTAETITFFFRPDSVSSRDDDFVLLRQANDAAPEIVARNVLKLGNEPFFSYQEEIGGDTIPLQGVWLARNALPLRHSADVHQSAADTGNVARIDRIRTVRVAFASSSGNGPAEQTTAFRRVVQMPNAGRATVQSCGNEPLFSSTVSASQTPDELRIEVSWPASFDEHSGETDVIRYAIFRRSPPAMGWGEPYFSIPAGQSSYIYSDTDVADGTVYQYAVAAQDCTPTLSRIKISNAVPVAL